MRSARIQVNGGAPATVEDWDGVLPAGARLLAPVQPGKIVAIGLNYLDHIRESGAEPPSRPLVFAKFPSSVIGPEEPIRIPTDLTERHSFEHQRS